MIPKTPMLSHQQVFFDRFKDVTNIAQLSEMGTGKSKMALDIAAYAFGKGEINTVLILAPSGVHRNWVLHEIPKHLALEKNLYRAAAWDSKGAPVGRLATNLVLDPDFYGLRLLSMNYEAIITSRGREALKRMYSSNCLLILDESTCVKTPGAKRTKLLRAVAHRFKRRMIITGSPVAQSPLDAYSQFAILGEPILGMETFAEFKRYFAEWEEIRTKTGRSFPKLVSYKNLDVLQKAIASCSFRVMKKDVLDLPEKVFTTRYVEMTADQSKLYRSLTKEMKAELGDAKITTPHHLSRLIRLQQILGGNLVADSGEKLKVDSTRVFSVMRLLEECTGKVIIFCRFIDEIKELHSMIRDSVAYYGEVSKEERSRIVDSFQNDARVRVFIGQIKAAAYGLTLTAASTVVYYSNDFSVEVRMQSEDRAHRIGQRNPVTYVDLVAKGTIDEHILEALRQKKDISDYLTGGML